MKKLLLCSLVLAASLSAGAQTILSEDFQGGTMPAGWSQTTLASDGGWKFGDAAAHQSWKVYFQVSYPIGANKFAFTNDDKCYCNKSADRLILPAMNWSSYSKVYISFDAWYFPVVKNNTYATLEISLDNGATWQQVFEVSSWMDPLWVNQNVDLSTWAGQSNVRLSFKYNDNGQNWKGFGVDNVRIYQPYPNDASANLVTLTSDSKLPVLHMIKSGMDSVQVSLTNRGTNTITSLEMNYSVNGGATQTQTLSGLNLQTMVCDTLTLPMPWNFSTTGTSNVKAWVSKVNGSTDQYSANDTASYTTGVSASSVQRKLVFEEFSNAGCSPCASVNPDYLVVMNANTSRAVQITYHTYWPTISDPMYQFNIPDNTDQRNYYHIEGVPSGNVNGNWLYYFETPLLVWSDYTLIDRLDYHHPRPGFFNLGISGTYNGSTISITGNYASLANFIQGSFSLKVFLVETLTYTTAPGPNGEKFFPNAMRKMFPNPAGTPLGVPTTSTNGNFNFSYNYPSAVNPANCQVVVYVQNDHTHHIYQVDWANLTPTGVDEPEVFKGLSIYPNPSSGVFNLAMSSFDEVVTAEVYNTLGEKVHQQSITETNNRLDLSNQAKGMYFVNLRLGDKMVTRKVSIQ